MALIIFYYYTHPLEYRQQLLGSTAKNFIHNVDYTRRNHINLLTCRIPRWHVKELPYNNSMAKGAKQQVRSNTIKRVTEGSYADLYHKEAEDERRRRNRMRQMTRGNSIGYNCKINW